MTPLLACLRLLADYSQGFSVVFLGGWVSERWLIFRQQSLERRPPFAFLGWDTQKCHPLLEGLAHKDCLYTTSTLCQSAYEQCNSL